MAARGISNRTMKERRKIPPPLLTMDEAVAYLKIPKDTLYKMVSQGRIPVVKITSSNRFNQALLDEWIKEKSNEWIKEKSKVPIINST
jgi:excisionase family DNA binding protein